ncbi:hypothetical protein GKZ92_22940 (plasmid) [Gordonia sp. 135]|uniref:type IV toxin-antitoxin system AbiEi family antitoxin domain-containing protein n=1 Tax=Gordonia sp. 135 TaxID=2676309 RepID=UPI0012BB2A10|nr:type IV toxin-antitoxin system AbiEi family antitoxin domain-containing protein [Gordonia sp. 135]QGP90578.1 hypothetical protein GKZ92_22940 [Gordonia sp. 135]
MTSTPPPRLNTQLTLRWLDIADLLAEQWGFITSGQCARLELTRTDQKRLRQNGYLVPVAHGVMCQPDHLGDRVVDTARLAWVAAGKDLFPSERLAARWPDYVVTAMTALELHGLSETCCHLPQLAVIRTSSGHRRTATAQPIGVSQPLSWHDDVTVLDGLPVATPASAIKVLGSEGRHLVDDLIGYLRTIAEAAADHPDHDAIMEAIASVIER